MDKKTGTKGTGKSFRWNGAVTDKDVQNVARLIKEKQIQVVDLKFNDLPGLWQHFSIPASELTEFDDIVTSIWEDGIGFDGSSIRGFQKINESDMILMPDPSSAVVDPICAVPTLSVLCDIYDPITKKPYTRDPRYIGKKAEAFLKTTGFADQSFYGPEQEFFIFDDIRFDQTVEQGLLLHRLRRRRLELGPRGEAEPRLQAPLQGRLLPGPAPRLPPGPEERDTHHHDPGQGSPMEVHHHEVATAGQCEMDMKYGPSSRWRTSA